MKKRTSDLLNEMQGIFGGSFGNDTESLTESKELSEGPGRRQGKPAMNRPIPSDKGKVKGKGGGRDFPGRSGKKSSKSSGFGSADKISKLAKAASLKNKDSKTQDAQEKRYKRAVDAEAGKKSKGGGDTAKSDKRDTSDKKASSGGGGSQHSPFAHQSSRGKGPGTPPSDPNSKNIGKQQDPRTKQDSRTNCWSCKCSGNTGTSSGKCKCTSSGTGKNCPPANTEKIISFQDGYKKKYNRHYRAWKRGKGK
jgi:hypothetical protein